jgi:hypothetical protein
MMKWLQRRRAQKKHGLHNAPRAIDHGPDGPPVLSDGATNPGPNHFRVGKNLMPDRIFN